MAIHIHPYLSLSRQCVIPWSDIKAIKLNKGYISIQRQKGWFNWTTATVSQTPNVFIFIELVDRLKGITH